MDIKEKKEQISLYKNQVNEKIRKKEVKDLLLFLQRHMDVIKYDNDLMTVWYLGMIAKKEWDAGKGSMFEKVDSLDALLERYRKLKFYVRRIEYDVMDHFQEFYSFLAEQGISEYELMGIVDSCAYNKDKVWKLFG